MLRYFSTTGDYMIYIVLTYDSKLCQTFHHLYPPYWLLQIVLSSSSRTFYYVKTETVLLRILKMLCVHFEQNYPIYKEWMIWHKLSWNLWAGFYSKEPIFKYLNRSHIIQWLRLSLIFLLIQYDSDLSGTFDTISA